jgi:hypothetical protein
LEYYWEPPPYLIWHILNKDTQHGNNFRYCGRYDEPCLNLDFALKEISYSLLSDYYAYIEIKKIGINPGGYELTSPIEINPSSINSNNLLIMKELYGTPLAMND